MPKINLIKMQGGFFMCATQQDYDLTKRFKVGDTSLADIKKPRNGAFHRKCFSLLNFVFGNQEKFSNFKSMRSAFCMEAGHFTWEVSFSGKQYPKAKSMDYDSMDDAEFSVLFDKFINIALAQFGEGMPEGTLRQYINGVMDYT